MRSRFKVWLVAALACGLAIGLAACGGSGDDTGSGSAEAPADLSGTITVWDLNYEAFGEGYDEAAEDLIAQFERNNPGVKVNLVAQPFEGFEPIYQAAFAAKEGPDVMMNVSGPAGVLRWRKGLEVLNDRMPPGLQENITNWSAATEGVDPEGDHYGIPVGAGGSIFYYNKDLFAKAGLPREFQPESWEELREVGEKLKAAGIQPFTGGNKEGYENAWWFASAWQTVNTPEQSVELNEGKLPITDEAFANAVEPELMMQEAGLYPKDRFTTAFFPTGAARFGEGKGAIAIGIRSLTADYHEYNEMLGEKTVGMFLPPGSTYFNTEAEWVWSIPTFADNKDAAWAFIEFMTTKQGVKESVDKAGILPNRLDVELPADAPEQAHQLVDWGREMDVFLSANLTVPVPLETLYAELNQVMQGRSSLEETQQVLQETAEKTAR